jgi:hypothetical protein
MPVAVDALRLARRFGGVEAALPLMQAVDLAAESHQLRPARPVPAPVDPGEDSAAAGERLRALIEAEEGEAAEALLRGALARGWGREVVEPWLFSACADHFLDFGHALIYQIKVFDLLGQIGWGHAEALLPAHLRGIVDGTREDLLAEWAWFRRSLDDIAPRLDALWAAAAAAHAPRGDALFAAVVDGGRQEAFDAVVAELARGAGPAAIVDVLVAAAAERILRFDVAIDGDPTVQEGWLDVTHLLTFTAAVRQALARYRRPEALRLVLQATRFINHARPLDLPVTGRPDVAPRPPPATTSAALAQLEAAVASRDPDAPAMAAGYLAAGHPVENLRIALEDLCLDDVATRPIVVGHLIKTCVAAFDEHDALPAGEPRRAWPVLALVRLLSSPVRERPVRRLTHEAIQLVIHGKVPRTLT